MTALTPWLRRAAATTLGLMVGATSLVATARPAAAAYDIYRGPNNSQRVTLTFDDCPTSISAFRATVLAAERLDIGLVLFPTGNCVSGSTFDAAFARAHGHYVFNHSINHPDLTTLSKAGVQRELGAPGIVTSYGRPPYGAINSTVRAGYAAVGMTPWLWSVDTNDWRGKSRSEIVNYVVSTAQRRDSVLMHMQWNGFNETALSAIKAGLAGRGIGVCRNYPGTTPVRPTALDCDAGGSAPTAPSARVFGDENGDGRADVLGVPADGSLILYGTRANLTLGSAQVVGHGWQRVTWFGRVPDVSGDGRADLLARRNDGSLWFYKGQGGASFGYGTKVGSGWNGMSKLAILPDVDGDGRPELVAAGADAVLRRYSVSATGVTQRAAIGTGWGANISTITTVGNSSGDATSDILAVTTDGRLISYAMSRSGRIVAAHQVGRGWTGFTAAYSPGDMDGDGSRDLVGRRSDGTLYGYRHLGGGRFSAAIKIGTGWNGIRLFA